MKSQCPNQERKKNEMCGYAHASGGARTRAIDGTMMSFVNILFLRKSYGFWQFSLTPLDYELMIFTC